MSKEKKKRFSTLIKTKLPTTVTISPPSCVPLQNGYSPLNNLSPELKVSILIFLNISAVLSFLAINKEMSSLIGNSSTAEDARHAAWLWGMIAQRIFNKDILQEISTQKDFMRVVRFLFGSFSLYSPLCLAMINDSKEVIEKKFKEVKKKCKQRAEEKKEKSSALSSLAIRTVEPSTALNAIGRNLAMLVRYFSDPRKKELQLFFLNKVLAERAAKPQLESAQLPLTSNLLYMGLVLEQKEAEINLHRFIEEKWQNKQIAKIMTEAAKDSDLQVLEKIFTQVQRKMRENEQERRVAIESAGDDEETISLHQQVEQSEWDFFQEIIGGALTQAARNGHLHVLTFIYSLLGENGYRREQINEIVEGADVLLEAINNQHFSIVKLLINNWRVSPWQRYSVRINDSSFSVSFVYFSVKNANLPLTAFLLRRGVELSEEGIEIMSAVQSNNPDLVVLLWRRMHRDYLDAHVEGNTVELGAYLHRRRFPYHCSPLSMALSCQNPSNDSGYQIVKILLDNSAPLTDADKCAIKPFITRAVERNDQTMIFALLAGGFNVNARLDRQGRTMLQVAALSGHVGMVKFLLAREASSLLRENIGNKSPLGLAIIHGQHNVVKTLLDDKAKAKVNEVYILPSRDSSPLNTQTPLQLAVQFGHRDILLLLVLFRANINQSFLEDGQLKLAVQLALDLRRYDMVEILLNQHLIGATRRQKKSIAVLLRCLKKDTPLNKLPTKYREGLLSHPWIAKNIFQYVCVLEEEDSSASESKPFSSPYTLSTSHMLSRFGPTPPPLSLSPRPCEIASLASKEQKTSEQKTSIFSFMQSLNSTSTSVHASSDSPLLNVSSPLVTSTDNPFSSYSPQ